MTRAQRIRERQRRFAEWQLAQGIEPPQDEDHDDSPVEEMYDLGGEA
jgi:hypothetical protein